MNWKSKVAIVTSVIVAITALLFIIKIQHDMLDKQANLEKSMIEQKELSNGLVRSQANLVTKADLERYAKDLKIDLSPIEKHLSKLNAEVQGIQNVKIVTTGYVANNVESTGISSREEPSTGTTPNPDPTTSDQDPFKYQQERQYLELSERIVKEEVPIGTVGFSAWKEKPWDISILPREYTITSVLGQDPSGRHVIYNKAAIVVNGEEHELKISESRFIEETPGNSFSWSPRLYVGIGAGAYINKPTAAVVPSLEIAMFSYGPTKTDPNLSILALGLGYEAIDKQLSFVLTPITYNVGHDLPLVENVHLRPTVGLTPSGDFELMAGVGFGL
jgi:hypothetical protein